MCIVKRFSILHIPFLSFFSRDLYVDVALRWKGSGFGYLLLLLVVCWLPMMVKMYTAMSTFIDEHASSFIEQVPTITFDQGLASINEPQPYYIKVPDSNEVIAIIDTTGTIQSLENTDAHILLTQTQVIYRENNVTTKTIQLSDIQGQHTLDQNIIWGFLGFFKKILFPVILLFILIFSFVYRIIQALIYAAIGLLFASWCRARLQYTALLRLAVVAFTPCIIVSTILGLARVHLPWGFLWYLLAALGYLLFGVNAVSQAQEQAVEPEIVQENPQHWPEP